MSQPLISVITPTCERSGMINRAIDSIYAQTWPNIEVIVVDDNEPASDAREKTRNALKQYFDRENFHYITTTGKTGGGAARNLGIRCCNGEYVAFLDDDDRYLPQKLEKQVLFMMKRDLDVSYQDVEWVDENDKCVELRRLDYTDDFSQQSLLKTHLLRPICPTAVYMIRREALLKTEGFGETCSGQDYILMLRCIEKGLKIEYMPGVYVIQYLHNEKRISLGDNKIKGENMLYDLRRGYFSLLSFHEQCYVRFRHYAVLSFASMRSHRPVRAFGYAVITFLTSPGYCVSEAVRYFGKAKRG